MVLEGITDVETAEATACREGLALACDLTLQSIRLVSDSANVIRSLEETGMGLYAQVVKEVKAKARDFFLLILLMRIGAQMLMLTT